MGNPKSQFTPKFLTRLLFEFKEPFDTSKAMEAGFKYGGEAKLDVYKLTFFYKFVFNILFDILDTVFTPYISKPSAFVIPDPVVVDDFRVMLNVFYLIQNHWLFAWNHIYFIDFTPFDPIEGDNNRLITNWRDMKGAFLDHKARIYNICRLQQVPEVPIPYRLARFQKAIINNLSKQREYQNRDKKQIEAMTFPVDFMWDEANPRIYHFGKYGSIAFTAHRSKRLQVFKQIVDKRGEPVKVRSIARHPKVNRDDHYVYSVLRDINKLIQNDAKGISLIHDSGTVFLIF